ncbi:MAG TPA: 2'-5' RNA ligase family protein [Dongiaceae bacterium]|nr:2'-5' RNA ligase family protein [Dongiaceae bacterium]
MTAETVLMVVVPEAEGLVKPFRDRFDPSASLGAPAHITVLYPFLPPERIDEAVCDRLVACCAAQVPIDFQLTEIRRFGDEVLYLAPAPDEPLRQLTLAIWRLFPETPPYAGRHAEIIPHLSIAWVQDPVLLRKITQGFTAKATEHLPISGCATSLTLFDNASGRWEQRQDFPFGGRRGQG